MSIQETVLSKVNELSDCEFDYSTTSDFGYIDTLNTDCTAMVLEAVVCYFEIKNPELLLKTGKRLAARIYKIYYHTLFEVAKKSGAYLNCFDPNSFLLIYPKDKHDVSQVVDTALRTAELLSMNMKDIFDKHGHLNFAMGIDAGNVLGTVVTEGNGNKHTIWFGKTVNKAKTICHECIRPFYVGISGSVFHHLDESLKTTQKRIFGIKKNVEIWNRVSYQFENVKKHLYQTNFHKSFSDD